MPEKDLNKHDNHAWDWGETLKIIMDSLFSSRLAHKAHAWLVCASHLSISMLGIDILREKTREKREAFSVSMTCETIVCD